jgi:hypothetical protein
MSITWEKCVFKSYKFPPIILKIKTIITKWTDIQECDIRQFIPKGVGEAGIPASG